MEQIISIVTVCVTFTLGILGLLLNSMIQRKNNSLKMITQHRFDRRSETQKLTAVMIRYSDPDMIRCLSTEEEKNAAKTAVIDALSRFRVLYSRSFACDVRLLERTQDLKDRVIRALDGAPVGTASTDAASMDAAYLACRAAFMKEVDIYTATEWKRIKLETIGKGPVRRKSFGVWDQDYQKISDDYNRHNAPDEPRS